MLGRNDLTVYQKDLFCATFSYSHIDGNVYILSFLSKVLLWVLGYYFRFREFTNCLLSKFLNFINNNAWFRFWKIHCHHCCCYLWLSEAVSLSITRVLIKLHSLFVKFRSMQLVFCGFLKHVTSLIRDPKSLFSHNHFIEEWSIFALKSPNKITFSYLFKCISTLLEIDSKKDLIFLLLGL